MLWTIIGLLLLFWIIGLVFHIAGGLIHLLLVVAVVVFIFKLISGRTKNRA
ncbi:lmo0937 family membrane protein [Neobacillus cucumis]|uniref:lmo0937 family membrane protein n=1 Tax=Neobacillus cucumis TaxID=1740721 RepID=UPI001159FE1D|nr:lmo0937 family membrane protein [Neobacillus cucumis]